MQESPEQEKDLKLGDWLRSDTVIKEVEHYLEGWWWKWRELIKNRAFNESLSCVKNASYSHNNPKVTLILTHVSTDFLTWKQWMRGVK